LAFWSLARRTPSAEVNSVMISPQPPRLRMKRRKTVSVTPAMGASTVAGAISTLPICKRSGTAKRAGPVLSAAEETPAPPLPVPGLSQNLRTWLFYCLPLAFPICHNRHHIAMDENKAPTPEPSLNPGKLTGLVVAAVILGAGIWGLLASITNNLLVPLLARVMEVDPQSPLYLGKGELNIPALLNSVLALCLAGIVFALLLQWSRRKAAPARIKMVRATKPVSQSAGPLSIAPILNAAPAPVAAPTPTAVAPPQPVAARAVPVQPPAPQSVPPPAAPAPQISPAPVPVPPIQPKPAPAPAAAPAKPPKPQPAKPVYYNIVGEPILPTEDD